LAEPSNVHPYLLAVLLCDSVINEAGTGKKTIVGTFDKLLTPAFPAGYPFTIYVKFTDAQGSYRLRFEYVNLSTDTVLESRDLPLMKVPDRLEPAELVVNIAANIPEPGSYEFRLYIDGAWFCRAPFSAALIVPEE